MKEFGVLKLFLILWLSFSGIVLAKEYTNTSFYVAYDSADSTQFALVLPSVNKVYTHKAGQIAATDLKQIDTQFVSSPTYNNGELCFSALVAGASGDNGASVMANKCYTVNFFYTQKEEVPNVGIAFILTYRVTNKVYEGIAGDAASFKVVRDENAIYSEDSITNENYSDFSFDISLAKITMNARAIVFDQNITMIENTAKDITLTGTDVDGDTLTFSVVANPTHGTLNGTAPNLTYTPNANYIGVDSFTYKVSDGNVDSLEGIILIYIQNNITFISSATVTVPENQTDALTLQVTNASSPIIYSISGGDSSSFDVNSSTGKVTFLLAPDFETRDTYSFTAKATDESGNEVTQSVTVNISDIVEGQALKKTGQTKSYDASGNEVTDGSIRDDGFYQAGTTPSYTRDDVNNIVIDHVTGLQWQDDVNVSTVTKSWLTKINYDICTGQNGQTKDTNKCTDTIGDTAATYCSTLSLGGFTDWRLPTIDELMYIADRSKSYPAIDAVYFQNVVSKFYWSSSTVVGLEDFAWDATFSYGYSYWRYKSDSYHVRCTRVGQ